MHEGDQCAVVVAQTEKWLVLAKPAGWLTIPGRTAPGATPVPVLSEWAGREFGPLWTVHRLDRDTSGVILFARSPEAHREANTWFQSHRVRKTYECLVQGSLAAPMIRIQKPIEGMSSTTQVELRESFGAQACLLRVMPLTGRRHQIRIHLSDAGYPLLGDPQYKGPRELPLPDRPSLQVERVALHAARLELPTREVFEAPWPEDFSAWVSALRGLK